METHTDGFSAALPPPKFTRRRAISGTATRITLSSLGFGPVIIVAPDADALTAFLTHTLPDATFTPDVFASVTLTQEG